MVMGEIPKIRVDNYDIIRTIGKGNFASVKLARHRVTKTEVAIKIIEKFRLDQSDLKKIYREIQILKLLKHPHIMKLYEVIETKTKIYLVCEYASNGEVFDYITQEERIPEDKARKMFYQVLTAIEYCHKHNVVHRDLKAENLLLDANNNIKLADFGFGNFFQSGQNLNTWCGSPPYAAPEVFEGKLYEGPQLDIWSMGIVLYVLVCGTFPFDGSNLASLKDRVLAGRFRIPYWMSQDCENLIRRMLVVNPKKRLTITQIKKHKWLEPVATKPEITQRKCDSPRRSGPSQLPEFNEHILKIMQGFGLDRTKTIESLRNSSYDYLYAVYHLLLDRLKHHRTSVPVETRFTYDGGKRRPSNIAEQTMSKHIQSSSPTSKPHEPFRFPQKSLFYKQKPGQQPACETKITTEEVQNNEKAKMKREIQFIEETGNDVPPVQRTLKLGTLPLIAQAPNSPTAVSKPKYFTQPYRGPLPHQPWSFNSGLGIRATYFKSVHPSIAEQQQQLGSGDVIPSVSSIDEGVELRSTSPSEQEMINLASSQQRRHTLGIPGSLSPFSHLILNSSELAFRSKTRDESQADSLFGSSGVSNYESETLYDSTEMTYDSTPKVVLSPCVDESAGLQVQADSPISYADKQRQLLNVSPTGFREGRRASDGLLLLADGKIGEHLKRLSRANHFPPISQEENDDSCFETYQRDVCRPTYSHLKPEIKLNELGAMTSHSSHHVMQVPHSDVINYQPYASPNRRRSVQVAQYLAEERCSSYSKGFELRQQQVFFQPPQILQHSGQFYEQPDVDQLYQWSSWKTVTENELPNSDALQQRRDTLPFAARENVKAFPVWSDESMGRSTYPEKGIRQSSLSGIGCSGSPSLVQILQKRKLSRRRNIALNSMTMQQSPNYQLQEFEQLKIVDSLNGSNLVNPDSIEELAAKFPSHNLPHFSPNFEGYPRNSPELQQPKFPEIRDGAYHPTFERISPTSFTPNSNVAFLSWTNPFGTNSPPITHTHTAMEYSS